MGMDEDPRQPGDAANDAFAPADEAFGDEHEYEHEQADANGQPPTAGDPAEALGTLVAYLARNLVDEPDGVEVEARRQGNNVAITLRVPESELGKVIGRQGRIARAVRTALTIAGSRYHVRASLDIEG
jgi:hypothetical protein